MKRLQSVVIGILVVLVCVVGFGVYRYQVITTELDRTREELRDREVDLARTQQELLDTWDELAETQDTLVEVQAKLSDTEDILTRTESELAATVADYQEFSASYLDICEQINSRLGGDSESAKSFVTVEAPMVTEMVEEITGGFSENKLWAHYKRLYDWVVDNIDYSTDSPIPVLPFNPVDTPLSWESEYWRMPDETIQHKAGDCEDMAFLLASMIINYQQGRYATWIIGIRSASGAHLAVAFPVEGGQITILDPAGNYYTRYRRNLSAERTSAEINNWLRHWSDKMPEAHVEMVFNDRFYKTFSSTEEFLTWVEE